MNNHLLVPTLLLLSLFSTSLAHLDGAREESCYNHSIVHLVPISANEFTLATNIDCFQPCGYQLDVIGKVLENGTIADNVQDPKNFTYEYNTTYQLELKQEGLNGFLGFLVQARNMTDSFDPASTIYGTWEANRPLYRPLNCGKSMADTSDLFPNSATQILSNDIGNIPAPTTVFLYWVSPAEQDNPPPTVVFWYTIVQQLAENFNVERGPVGHRPPPPPPTTEPPATDAPITDASTSNSSTSDMAPTGSSTTEDNSSNDSRPTLSLTETIGVGVGGGVAALLLIVIIIITAVMIKRCCCGSSKGKDTKKSGPGAGYSVHEDKVDVNV